MRRLHNPFFKGALDAIYFRDFFLAMLFKIGAKEQTLMNIIRNIDNELHRKLL